MSTSPGPFIELLRIGPDDWKLWRKLRLEALNEAPSAFISKLSDWEGKGESRWRSRLGDVPLNIVSYLDRAEAGMVSAVPSQDGAVELISMWVAPFARGRGVGDALVAAVIAWAGEQKAVRVSLAVFETNWRAIGLYLRHGFVNCAASSAGGSGSPVERKMIRELSA